MNSEETNGTKPKTQVELTFSDAKPIEDKVDPKDMMEVNFDGPFGAPATNIFRAEHAVLGNFRQLFLRINSFRVHIHISMPSFQTMCF